jgi:hypothetical protein
MNFQKYLKNSFRFVKEEPFILLGWSFVLQLLFIISQGFAVIFIGPLLGGYFLLTIAFLRDNRKPSYRDLLKGFEDFGRLFPYFFLLLIKAIGFILLVIPGVLFATWWIYVLPLMVDRKMSFSDAMRLSMNKVNKTSFIMHFVFLVLVYVVPIILLNILFLINPFLSIFSIVLLPIQAGCLASLYIDQFKELEVATAPGQQQETAEATPTIPPPAEIIESSVEEETESLQTEQSVSKEPETSEQPTDESLPKGNELEEKPVQEPDVDQHQAEKESDKDTEKDDKDNS